MKKKFLSLVVMLLSVLTGAWAQTSDLNTPLTLKATTAGTIKVNSPKSGMKYKKNSEEMVILSTTTTTIDVAIDDVVEFYGNGTNITNYNGTTITGSGDDFECTVYGNIMSLVNETGFASATTLESNAFYGLFMGNTTLTDASGLLLPATTLAYNCYYSMFNGCTALTAAPTLSAPTLSAPTLADHCYHAMFYNCTSLATAPALPATTLKEGCYQGMFLGCSSLTAAPELPATTLAKNCYQSMFEGCTKLTSVPALPATTLATYCYYAMFNGCTSLATTPTLPATTLTSNCYNQMFQGCRNLISVRCLATNISASKCTRNWLNGVAATGTFYDANGEVAWAADSPSGIPSGWTRSTKITLNTPLVMEAITDGTIVVSNPKSGMKYSIGGETNTMSSTTIITVTAGQKVQFFGNSTDYHDTKIAGGTAEVKVYGNIMSLVDEENFASATELTSTRAFESLFFGNTMLTDASNLLLPATTLATYSYNFMFEGCTGLTGAPALPATTLAEGCYQGMFKNCTSLTTAPELLATSLTPSCYNVMFFGCSSLATAPELPATTLANNCYHSMFRDCTSLTEAPTLPATTLVTDCYNMMFDGCTKLAAVTCLATDISAKDCTGFWLRDVAATGTFTGKDGAGWVINSPSGIPDGWTTEMIPTLSTPLTLEATTDGTIKVNNPKDGMKYSKNGGAKTAVTTTAISVNVGDKVAFYGNGTSITSYSGTTIADGSASCIVYGNIMSLVNETDYASATTLTSNDAFASLFYSNTKLTDASNLILPATTLTDFCYYRMFYNCSNLTAAPELPATTLALRCYSEMFYACSSLAEAPALPATTLTGSCYYQMFWNCSGLTEAPELPATTLATFCYYGMFWNCTGLTAAPVLPATTLVSNCYGNMFYGCKKLNTVTCLATDHSATGCTNEWLNTVAATGTFIAKDGVEWDTNSTSAIPPGWRREAATYHTLAESTDNSAWISNHNGGTYNVTLTRTLQTGGWNTFSVPFSTPIPSGWTVKELTAASYDSETKTLTLEFDDAESIEAGKPYMVKVNAVVENPSFNNVTISKDPAPTTITNVISFEPAINPTALTLGDKSYLFVSGGNSLTWANAGSSMKGFRAYFHILDSSIIANARAFSMDFSDGEQAGIENNNRETITNNRYYDLQGRLIANPTKGIYVVNGKKVVIK